MESNNLLGMLAVLKAYNIKPNFSELARNYGVTRQTVQRYWVDSGKKEITRNRSSVFDQYKDEIISLMEKRGVTKKSVYEFIVDKYGHVANYSTFRAYTTSRNITLCKTCESRLRFETAPGEQMQVDWKEDVILHSRSGQRFDFNILVSTLGYSRFHKFKYAKTRTTEEFIRCVCEIFNELGGGVEHILTDNMPALVNITSDRLIKLDKVLRFEREAGVKIKLCKSRSPYTKGKVESANRFISWLMAYDGEFDTEDDLIELITMINNKVNATENATTKKTPADSFVVEKEYLKSVPNLSLEKYVDSCTMQIVPTTQLVYYKGCGYSVPSFFVGKVVQVVFISDYLFIYHNENLVTMHGITTSRFNYKTDHYLSGIDNELDDETLDRVERNLMRLNDV